MNAMTQAAPAGIGGPIPANAGSASLLGDIDLAEEVPVALVYNGVSHAVMMATPQDLEEFALGFSLSEGVLADPSELLDIEQRPACLGISVEMTVTHERFAALMARRRSLVGRTGCGLCGVDSLEQLFRSHSPVTADAAVAPAAIARAVASLPARQDLHRRVHAVHAAAWATPDGDVVLVREDVGRHNALDKLIGALAGTPAVGAEGFAIITSRCSYEMVQKSVAAGIAVLVALSAPTRLAIDVAQDAGLTLVAWAKGSRGTVCTHPQRIL